MHIAGEACQTVLKDKYDLEVAEIVGHSVVEESVYERIIQLAVVLDGKFDCNGTPMNILLGGLACLSMEYILHRRLQDCS